MGVAPSKADKEDILKNGPYLLEGKGIITKEWRPNFDPNKETTLSFLIWINLQNLPTEYWEEKVLAQIGNTIGDYVSSKMVLNKKDSSSHPRILILLKEGNPCPDYINLSTENGVWKQQIETWEGEMENSLTAINQNKNWKGKGLEVNKLLDDLEKNGGTFVTGSARKIPIPSEQFKGQSEITNTKEYRD